MKKNRLIFFLIFFVTSFCSFVFFIMNINYEMFVGEGKNILFSNCSTNNDNVFIFENKVYALNVGNVKLSCPFGISYNINISNDIADKTDRDIDDFKLNIREKFDIYAIASSYVCGDNIKNIILIEDKNNILVYNDGKYMAQSEGNVKFLVVSGYTFIIQLNFFDDYTNVNSLNSIN